MSFQTFLAEAMQNPNMDVEEVGGEEEFDPQEIETGMKEEKEHKDLYDIFKQCADDNRIEMPLSEDDFYLTIVKAHLREDDKYYSKLVECMRKKED